MVDRFVKIADLLAAKKVPNKYAAKISEMPIEKGQTPIKSSKRKIAKEENNLSTLSSKTPRKSTPQKQNKTSPTKSITKENYYSEESEENADIKSDNEIALAIKKVLKTEETDDSDDSNESTPKPLHTTTGNKKVATIKRVKNDKEMVANTQRLLDSRIPNDKCGSVDADEVFSHKQSKRNLSPKQKKSAKKKGHKKTFPAENQEETQIDNEINAIINRMMEEDENQDQVTQVAPSKKTSLNKPIINLNSNSEESETIDVYDKIDDDVALVIKNMLNDEEEDENNDHVRIEEEKTGENYEQRGETESEDGNDEVSAKSLKYSQSDADKEEAKYFICVSNLCSTTTLKLLHGHFGKYGPVDNVFFTKAAGVTLCAMVRFKNTESQVEALVENGRLWNGRHLRVQSKYYASPLTDGYSVMVENLRPRVEEEDLWRTFECCGQIRLVDIPKNKDSHTSMGFGCVIFESSDAVQLALELKPILYGLYITVSTTTKELWLQKKKEMGLAPRGVNKQLAIEKPFQHENNQCDSKEPFNKKHGNENLHKRKQNKKNRI